ncbi:uroporphyrinogen-III C-methyltransferase [Hymenobacter sp. UV11]|uniref:uroporphyrinogen-III C-methyltransferase n=1 Tax=Hymenobacter sp. UV11 TaxID=1849735 RepID=UPI00105B549F|nr:uroporphyrinogen-III C-methyltransferase [Hymenobacter sp. UV11]TDN38452.1 uroporphyrinogen-III C-methyltransferase [Hymenobacter sp. UV11]TFZ67945.1 uroporphyrinogen-III C-methyltransferase [Hymenobacter sp. UV11]
MARLPPPPELYVVGAGPGDPELLTLKAYRILQTADVILYDNLANQELLALAPAACECIYVGKKPYGEYTPQEVIHELILEKARACGRVVRLKGGDPFIFGRGFEEMLFARSHGIVAHYVPGISSMQAVGFEDITLTHRVVSEGFWVLTGTKKDGTLSADLRLAMQSNSTVVIYMGMKKIAQIADTYVQEGRGNTPAAVVMHASLPHRKMVAGPVRDLPALVAAAGITYPAIIFIGDVVEIGRAVNRE